MMTSINKLMLDTHILIWYMEGIELTEQELKIIEKCRQNNNFYLSKISLWEIAMLVNKNKIALTISLTEWINKILQIDGLNLVELSVEVLINSCNLPSYPYKDPADRFIISSVREMNATLLTRDQRIINYAQEGFLNIL